MKPPDNAAITSTVTSTEALRALIPEKVHPAADEPPLWPIDKLLAAASELKRIGRLVEPIQRLRGTGQIIDGRHRRMLCLLAGIAPKFQDIELPSGLTPEDYVAIRNDIRRQLTLDQLAAVAALRYVTMRVEGKLRRSANLRKVAKPVEKEQIPFRHQGNSLTFLSALYGVNARYIQQATTVLEMAPEIFQQLRAGDVSLKDARAAIGLVQRERSAPKAKKQASYESEAFREHLQRLLTAVLQLGSIKPAKLKPRVRALVALATSLNQELRLA